jgi:hypothetical protein
MTLDELKTLAQTLASDDNFKIVFLVGKVADNDYEIVKVDSDGKVITTA